MIFCLLTGFCSAQAVSPGEARAAVGADLSDEQLEAVYRHFGTERGSVPELAVTNAEERQYLEGLVDDELIGSRSVSCAYVEILPEGSGLEVRVDAENISWCSAEMYRNALITAGVGDARLIVTAPVPVSGTAALTGVYRAYEDMSGTSLAEDAKSAGTQELVVTAELADTIGDEGAVAVINELKLILDQIREMSDEELREQIGSIAGSIGVTLTEDQVSQLLSLCRSLEKLDVDAIREKVGEVRETMQKIAEAGEKASGFLASIQRFFRSLIEFLSGLWERFSAA